MTCTYEDIVSICDSRGLELPVEYIDTVVGIVNLATRNRTQGADDALGDRTLAFIDLLNHYDSTMRNVMALPSGRTQEQKDQARLALIKAFETRATPADHISQARDAVIEECAKVCDEEAQRLLSLNLKMQTWGALNCADRIRALKSAPPEKPAGNVSDS